MKKLSAIIGLILIFFAANPVFANVIVRMKVFQGAAGPDYINLKLFDTIAPLTVSNFLKYVNDTTTEGGNYNNSFIHRKANSPQVIQGGGFLFDPDLNGGSFTYDSIADTYPGGFQRVIRDVAVDNEFSLSNLRGTIAMAKTPGDINSATSEWFINLVDNSFLDSSEGGFTVFGEVIGNSIQLVDDIAVISVFNKLDIHPALGELPLISYNGTDPVQQSNLAWLETVEPVMNITADIDFGNVIIGDTVQRDITIENIRILDLVNGSDVVIGNIADLDPVDSPFSIVSGSDNCSNIILLRTITCNLTIEFSPQSEADYSDTFNIEFSDPAISYSFQLTGRAADSFVVDLTTAIVVLNGFPTFTPTFTELNITEMDFGDLQLLNTFPVALKTINFALINDGNADLNVTSVDLTGSDDFTIVPNCLSVSPVKPGDFCLMPVTYTPSKLGTQTATMAIHSNDLNETPLIIPLIGSASEDVDGISLEVENAAPNNGDNNIDGIPDAQQSNVASLPGENNQYISLVTTAGLDIKNVKVLTKDQLVAPPDGIALNFGALDFSIENFLPGSTVIVGLILPQGTVVDTFYMYGPTPDNINPHWYDFSFDGKTGVVIIGDADFTNPLDVKKITRSLLSLVFIDGERVK